jgi:preprotein translocase subunit SecB
MKEITNQNKSIMQLTNLYFKNISFSREKLNIDDNLKIFFDHEIRKNDNDTDVVLSVLINDENNALKLSVELVGTFAFSNSENVNKNLYDNLINKNAIAILFPYLRSQVTLITSQPNMTPIILPPININTLLKNDD